MPPTTYGRPAGRGDPAFRRAITYAVMSLFVPGSAHIVAGRRSLGRVILRVWLVLLGVGLLAGLLANAGGFLLVPLYLAVLKLPIKTALAGSLAVASVLAIPGTIVHAGLGHIDWTVTVLFAASSIPLSSVGASVALRMNATRLERLYGAGLLALGTTLLAAQA